MVKIIYSPINIDEATQSLEDTNTCFCFGNDCASRSKCGDRYIGCQGWKLYNRNKTIQPTVVGCCDTCLHGNKIIYNVYFHGKQNLRIIFNDGFTINIDAWYRMND